MTVKTTTVWTNKYVEVKSFYYKHFPTDKETYNVKIPLVGLVLSILTLHFVTTSSGVRNDFRREESTLVKYCYILIATAMGYELYYGLKIGDRKHFTPWIILKTIELVLSFSTVIYIFTEHNFYYVSRYHVSETIYGLVLLILNGFVTYIVTSTSWKHFYGYVPATDNAEKNTEVYAEA